MADEDIIKTPQIPRHSVNTNVPRVRYVVPVQLQEV